MSRSGQQIPHRTAPPSAGGGRPSTTNELYSVPQLGVSVQAQLKSIYKSIETAVLNQTPATDSPPVSSYADFEEWFKTPAASAVAPAPPHDLTYPISNYYISSSHNTYLSGNQFYGASTGEAYENVLRRGCRCLEIDVWDGDDESSSVSSSDVEEEARSRLKAKPEGARARANSKLAQMKDRLKDKTSKSIAVDSTEENKHTTPRHQHAHHGEVLLLKYEPRVKHGYTLTKDIPFRTVCHAIKDSAFHATDLPLIVSLEVHCTLEQQEIMVDILQTVFKDNLVNISHKGEEDIKTLPSPDELRNKILIKVKWSPHSETGESNNPLEQIHTHETEVSEDSTTPDKKKKASKILHTLSALGVYTRGFSFKHFEQPEAKIPTHVFSLSEAKVEDIHADSQHGPALIEHNRNFLMRCYPSGIRVDSSNLDPCFLWRQGAQMVALNWQKLDRGMMLNEGMFSGEEGWVLKPEGLRGKCDGHGDNPSTSPKRQILDLEIELLAAQGLPMSMDKDTSRASKLKPYVKIQLHIDTHGPPGQGSSAPSASESHAHFTSRYKSQEDKRRDHNKDEEVRKLKQKSRTRKTADPDFEGEVMRWSGIHDVVEDLSFLRLKFEDDRAFGSDDLIAWACIKLSRLRDGYRFIHLLDPNGGPSQGLLLVRILKTLR